MSLLVCAIFFVLRLQMIMSAARPKDRRVVGYATSKEFHAAGPWRNVSAASHAARIELGRVSFAEEVENRREPVCLGILAYQGHRTLENTLASYNRVGLFGMVEAAHILFQQLDSPGRIAWAEDVARRFPKIQPIYQHTNSEFQGFVTMQDACRGVEMVLLLEEDFEVSKTMGPKNVRDQIQNAVRLLRSGMDAVWMRHRKDAGFPHHAYETWRRTGSIGTRHLLWHVLWDDHAEDHVPEIHVCSRAPPKTWCASSAHAVYTNNPTMYRATFATRLYATTPRENRTYSTFEPWLQNYWSRQQFTVAYADGVFTHKRLDRNFGTLNSTVDPQDSHVSGQSAVSTLR